MDACKRCSCPQAPAPSAAVPLVPNSFRGRFVYLAPAEGKTSMYPSSGEYLVLMNSGYHLICVKPDVGYGGHECKTFNMKEEVQIVDSYDDPAFAKFLGNALVEWGEKGLEPAVKRQWIETVYTGAISTGRTILRIFGEGRPVKLPKRKKR